MQNNTFTRYDDDDPNKMSATVLCVRVCACVCALKMYTNERETARSTRMKMVRRASLSVGLSISFCNHEREAITLGYMCKLSASR